MTCLALHVTETLGSVAVGHEGGVVGASEFSATGDRAPVLLQEIERLLTRAGIAPVDLTAIAVTTGPGSFTGIRVGLATAQGLALARDRRLFACDSLKAVAAAQSAGAAPIAVVLDARRGEVYAAVYDCRQDGALQARIEPRCGSPAAAAQFIASACRPSEACVVAGSGAAFVMPALLAAGADARLAPVASRTVAAALIDLVRDGGCNRVAPGDLEPVYLRLSDAESKRAHRV